MVSKPGGRRITREIQDRLTDTCKLLEDLGHHCETVRLNYDGAAFNESTVRLWASTLGSAMEAFARMTGQQISKANTEAVTLATYRRAQSLTGMQMQEAMGAQNSVSRLVGGVMRKYDVLLTPGLCREVSRLGELDQNDPSLDLLGWWDQMVTRYSTFTALFNTTGQPAIMLPLWQSNAGLPLAMQFAGRAGDEETLYSLSAQLEEALPWLNRKPPLYA